MSLPAAPPPPLPLPASAAPPGAAAPSSSPPITAITVTPPAPGPVPFAPVAWPGAARRAAFEAWLAPLTAAHRLLPETLRPASADASFRRYLRLDCAGGGTRIVMDAPPDKERCQPFVQVQALMAAAGLNVPQILASEPAGGFMLLSDLGPAALIARLTPGQPEAARHWYLQAVATLLDWQKASRPGVLPACDAALLQRELALFPDWYLARHRQFRLSAQQQQALARAFATIVAHNLAGPQVFVHRDYMMRNLMAPLEGEADSACAAAPPAHGPLAIAVRPGNGVAQAATLVGAAPSANGNGNESISAQAQPGMQAPGTTTHAHGTPPRAAPPPATAGQPGPGASRLGVLDFQDAVYGPITYDMASLLRDAFISWDEDFVLDITVRYWEQARRAALLGARSASGWGEDFGEFYRAVEWMGLQRHLKVAGIFARLTLRDGKPQYLADTPRFIAYIRATASRYRELTPLLRLLDQIEGSAAVTGFSYGRVD